MRYYRSIKYIFAFLFLCIAFSLNAQGTYYDLINPNNSTFVDDLKGRIRSPYTKVSYYDFEETNVANFSSYLISGSTRGVRCVYSWYEFTYTGTFAWGTMSREHTWCHSWMPTYDSESGNEYSDQYHLFPTQQNNANGIRSNHPLGIVTTVISTFLDSKYGKNSSNQNVFEPRNQHKGDAARALLYMSIRYDGLNSKNWTFNYLNTQTLPNLTVPEAPQSVQVLLDWHRQDPPDKWEIDRNNYVQSIQQNRNPFVDHPEYVNYINFNDLTKLSPSYSAEPSNHVTGYSSSVSGNTMTISWTDATGAVVPTGYLIQLYDENSYYIPIDGFSLSENVSLDSFKVKYVSHVAGTNSYTFTGLTAGKTYYYRIYPYNGTGTTINYKIDGTIPAGNQTAAVPQFAILNEDFSSVVTGNNTSTDGSNTSWSGNTNFPVVSNAYQAGGAVRIGTSGSIGNITSKTLDLSVNGGSFKVSFKVKGWTTVEGDVKVTVSGITPQTVTYTSVMSGTFESKLLSFTGGQSNSTITIETTSKRAFIDDVNVYYESPVLIASTVNLSGFTYVSGAGPSSSQNFTLSGSNLSPSTGNIIVTGTSSYEVSTDNTSFGSSKTIAYSSGTLNSTLIYVRLKSGLAIGNHNSENISNSGGNAENVNITCSGSVTESITSLWTNPITGTDPNNSNPYTTGDLKNTNITVSGIGRGPGITGTSANDRYNANGWNSVSLNVQDYFYFTLTPTPGYEINFSNFVYTSQKSGTGPTNFAIRSSLDDYTNDIGTPTEAGTTIDLSGYQDINSTITFRFYAWNASSSAGTFSINDFTFNGTVNLFTPLSQALNITFSNVQANQMTVNWMSGSGTKRIVKINKLNSFSSPEDGTDPAANTTYSGSGEQVVYNGSLNSVTVTGLTAETDYYFRVYDYNGSGTSTLYNLSTGDNNPNSIIYINSNSITSGTYNNLVLNSGTATNISGNVTVNSSLTLTNGKLNIGSNNLILGTGATISGANASNYIVTNGTGVVTINNVGNSDVTLSIGTATSYNPVIIKNTTATNNVSVRVYTSITGTPPDPTKVVPREWDVTPSGSGNTLIIKFQFNSTDYTGTSFNPGGSVVLGHFVGGVWTEIPGTIDGIDPYVVTSGNITSFSPFVIGNQGALPVTISSLNSYVNYRNVKLNWVTETEVNNKGFEVERTEVRSQNLEFSKIGFINGHGTANTPTNYSFEDKNLNSGKYKYRLKQIDYNGNYEYFELNGEVEIGVPKKYDLSQNYPNPFNPVTKINFDLPENGRVDIRLYDMLGREVAVLVKEVRNAGYHTVQFDASKLSSGIYFYKMNAGKFIGIKKMAVIK